LSGSRWLAAANLAAKVALVLLLLFAVTHRDWDQFHGKAMVGRALTYPIAALIVPVWWLLRGRPRPYPHAIDLLVVAPFLIDTLGNALNLYDSISWWDDLNHLVNWAILTGACAVALRAMRLDRWVVAGLCVGFGATTAILWELLEYVTFIRDSPERATAYTDTLGDLALGLTGSVIAALLAAIIPRTPPGEPEWTPTSAAASTTSRRSGTGSPSSSGRASGSRPSG